MCIRDSPNALRGGVTTACTGPGSANVVGGTFTAVSYTHLDVYKRQP